MKLRKTLQKFTDLQEIILQNNDGEKGSEGWKYIPNSQLLSMLKLEIQELEEALISGDSDCIAHECADVANFAMMIADNN